MHDDFVSVDDVNTEKESNRVVALRRVHIHLFLSHIITITPVIKQQLSMS